MKYTIVLLRPDYIASSYGQDIYIAHVNAPDPQVALRLARVQARDADAADDRIGLGDNPDDYALCVTFAGHNTAIALGAFS